MSELGGRGVERLPYTHMYAIVAGRLAARSFIKISVLNKNKKTIFASLKTFSFCTFPYSACSGIQTEILTAFVGFTLFDCEPMHSLPCCMLRCMHCTQQLLAAQYTIYCTLNCSSALFTERYREAHFRNIQPSVNPGIHRYTAAGRLPCILILISISIFYLDLQNRQRAISHADRRSSTVYNE
jgi:hypothetical protein